MVKITFQPVSAQKPEKESDGDKITIPQAHVSLHTFLSLFHVAFVLCLSTALVACTFLHRL